VEILRREGFTVLGTEVIREGAVEIDGRLEPFVAGRRRGAATGTLWVAEVKAGAITADGARPHDAPPDARVRASCSARAACCSWMRVGAASTWCGSPKRRGP
jgi:hypothetical protein